MARDVCAELDSLSLSLSLSLRLTQPPFKAIALALFLLAVGTTLLSIGALMITGHLGAAVRMTGGRRTNKISLIARKYHESNTLLQGIDEDVFSLALSTVRLKT